MKRKLFVLALALCLLLTGCVLENVPSQTYPEQTGGGTTGQKDPFNTPEPMPGFDADNRYIVWHDMRLQEAGSIIFGGMGRFMRYYDTERHFRGAVPQPGVYPRFQVLRRLCGRQLVHLLL